MAINHRLPLYGASSETSPEPEPSLVDGAGSGDGALVVDEGVSDAVEAASATTATAAATNGAGTDRTDALMQVGDLARETGKTVRAIHLYEELQLLRPAARSKGRYRLYGPEALVRIRWIGNLQEMGFSLTEIQTIVRDWEQSGSAPRAMVTVQDLYRKKLDETRAHLRRLQTLERELEASIDYLETCDVCDPARLVSACNACDRHTCGEHVPDLVAGFRAN